MQLPFHISGKVSELYGRRFEPEGVQMLGDGLWRVYLFLGALVVLCALAWGLSSLFSVLSDLSATPESSPNLVPVLDRSSLTSTLQGFETRAAQFNSLQANPSAAVPDPSK